MTLFRRELRRQLRGRLRRRRLFQGCAFLLLLPTAAAFLPVQGRAPQQPITLVPVNPAPTPIHLPGPHVAAPFSEAAATRFARKHSRLPMLSGVASWYGKVLQGHRTASGERFNANALTACHPSLPFGTLVKVINLINHRSVTVRITDRGVLNANRVIDLSAAAAEELDMIRAGVAPVKLEVQGLFKGKVAAPPAASNSLTSAEESRL